MENLCTILKVCAIGLGRFLFPSLDNHDYSGIVEVRSEAEDYLVAMSDMDAIWYYERRRWRS